MESLLPQRPSTLNRALQEAFAAANENGSSGGYWQTSRCSYFDSQARMDAAQGLDARVSTLGRAAKTNSWNWCWRVTLIAAGVFLAQGLGAAGLMYSQESSPHLYLGQFLSEKSP